jgi:hypothetical protein
LGNAALSLGIVAFRVMTTSPRLELSWSDAARDIECSARIGLCLLRQDRFDLGIFASDAL